MPDTSHERALGTSAETVRVSVRGVELVGDRCGAGPDLIWGHGLTGSVAADDELGLIDWPRIAAANRVLRYDARGHGRSDATDDVADYHWRALADDQLALADVLGIDRFVAGGTSMGCATALWAAVAAPARIRALVLAIPPTAWATRAVQTDGYRATADLIAAGDHSALLAGAAAAPPPDPFVGDPRWPEWFGPARFAELLRTTDPARLARVMRGAARADLPAPDDLATIDVPTLILAWTGDAGHPVTTAARLQELVPHAELVVATTAAGLATWTSRIAAFLASL